MRETLFTPGPEFLEDQDEAARRQTASFEGSDQIAIRSEGRSHTLAQIHSGEQALLRVRLDEELELG